MATAMKAQIKVANNFLFIRIERLINGLFELVYSPFYFFIPSNLEKTHKIITFKAFFFIKRTQKKPV